MLKELPLTPEKLKKIFTNRTFLKRLKEAADTTLKSGWEIGFQVARDPKTGITYYGELPESAYNEDPEDKFLASNIFGFEKVIEKNKYHSQEYLHLILDIHTHPRQSSSHPSPGDLKWLAKNRMKYDEDEFNTPMMGIVSFPDKKRLDILLLQETRAKPMGGMGAEWVFDYITSQEGCDSYDNNIVRNLCNQAPNIRAELLSYQRNEKGRYVIEEPELIKLAPFAYTIKALELIK